MNYAHLHLMLNHIPVILFPAGVLLLAYGMIAKDDRLKRLSFVVFVLVALATIPVYLTGGEAEEVVEDLPGIVEHNIEEHEEASTQAFIAAEIAGAFCLVALIAYRRRPLPGWTVGTGFVLSLIVAGLMAYTSNLGGHIRHPETSPGWRPPASESIEKSHESDRSEIADLSDTNHLISIAHLRHM